MTRSKGEMRRAFARHAKRQGYSIEVFDDGITYKTEAEYAAWIAYQAAWRASARARRGKA